MKNRLTALFTLILLSACSNDTSVQPDSAIGFPHEWVFTIGGTNPSEDPSVARYEYLYTNKYVMYRDDILKSYPLKDLVDEEHCLFYVSESQSSTAKRCYTIQLNDEKQLFLGVGPSSNMEEIHLYITPGEEVVVVGNPSYFAPPDEGTEYSDSWKFYFHKMPDVDGASTYAIESVSMPGWYISDAPPGFNYAATVVTLQKEQNAESAPKWQCRSAN
jgi:hypothetical protein